MTAQQTARGPQLSEQASAMFDGQLPAAECELLARRLSSDPQLQRQWSRHALIGAAMRGEMLAVRRESHSLRDSVAARVRAELNSEGLNSDSLYSDGASRSSEEASLDAAMAAAARSSKRWARPLASAGMVAGVAALSIFWVRGAGESTAEAPAAMLAATDVAAIGPASIGDEIVLAPPSLPAADPARRDSGEPESYVVPLPVNGSGSIASTQLANYVVAHSEFSGALTRRSALSALVTAEVSPPADEATASAAVAGGR